jgi:hypothetical protein
LPTDLNTCTFYFVVVCAVCARSSHPVRQALRRRPRGGVHASPPLTTTRGEGERPNEQGVGVRYATLAAERMYVQPCHWSPCHLSPYLHASPKRVCVDVLTRGLMHPSSVLTPGSWEASISVPTLRGIDRLSEQNDRGLSPVDMPWTWTHNMAPEGVAQRARGVPPCNLQ